MGQDRRKYRYGKMLIGASRILNPQFKQIGLELTGAQVELLRNATMLFHEQNTFVDEYRDGYYLNASDADYDAILAIVADLELRLMGNMNTLFGFTNIYQEAQNDDDVSTSTAELTFATAPSDEIWVITQWGALNEDTRTTNNLIRIETETAIFNCASIHPDVANHLTAAVSHIIVGRGQHVQIMLEGCQEHDVVWGWVSGYKMEVPEL